MLKSCFTEDLTVTKFPKTTVCNYCEYADDLIPQRNESLDFPPEE